MRTYIMLSIFKQLKMCLIRLTRIIETAQNKPANNEFEGNLVGLLISAHFSSLPKAIMLLKTLEIPLHVPLAAF